MSAFLSPVFLVSLLFAPEIADNIAALFPGQEPRFLTNLLSNLAIATDLQDQLISGLTFILLHLNDMKEGAHVCLSADCLTHSQKKLFSKLLSHIVRHYLPTGTKTVGCYHTVNSRWCAHGIKGTHMSCPMCISCHCWDPGCKADSCKGGPMYARCEFYGDFPDGPDIPTRFDGHTWGSVSVPAVSFVSITTCLPGTMRIDYHDVVRKFFAESTTVFVNGNCYQRQPLTKPKKWREATLFCPKDLAGALGIVLGPITYDLDTGALDPPPGSVARAGAGGGPSGDD